MGDVDYLGVVKLSFEQFIAIQQFTAPMLKQFFDILFLTRDSLFVLVDPAFESAPHFLHPLLQIYNFLPLLTDSGFEF